MIFKHKESTHKMIGFSSVRQQADNNIYSISFMELNFTKSQLLKH